MVLTFIRAYHKIENISSDEPVETYDVVGPICESSDVFGKAVDITSHWSIWRKMRVREEWHDSG